MEKNMARKLYKDKLIDEKKIKERIKRIPNTYDYISENGNVYKMVEKGKFYKRKNYLNKYNGYLYTTLTSVFGKQITTRVHKLVALAFVPNPNNKPIIMHIDNDKANPNYKNLKWGTISENTKQAFDDGLIVTAKGWDDSQSKPICLLDPNNDGTIIKTYGSMHEGAKDLNVTLSAIYHQCKYKPLKTRKSKYLIRFLSEFLDLL